MSARKLHVYLAGPMRGHKDFNFPVFHHAAKVLRSQGFIVFSPAEHDLKKHGDAIAHNEKGDEDLATKTVGFSIREAMGSDLAWICAEADIVALLPGWEASTGATAERATGIAINISLMYLGKGYLP
jgi:hypothetical protein